MLLQWELGAEKMLNENILDEERVEGGEGSTRTTAQKGCQTKRDYRRKSQA